MKRALPIFVLVLLLTVPAFAQLKSNLIFFTEQGERFTVILNGLRQNDQPETNVKVTDLPAPNYKLKVIFEDQSLGFIDKTIYVNQGNEITYAIKRNNKNEWVVRFMNEVPLAQALPPAPGQYVMVYNTKPAPVQSTTQTTTVTQTYNDAPPQGVSVNMNVNDQSAGVSFNMNVNGMSNTGQMNTTSTSTSYSTTTTTTTSGDYGDEEYEQEIPAGRQAYVLPGYSGPVGCPYPMYPEEFASVKQSIASKSFDDTRLTIAKQVIASNCLLSSQVKEIMLLFTFEDTRLDLAKYAYGYTYDIGNFYKLNDAFTFESSIEELNEYIQGFRR
ncbi:MAG: DUF4476 domain-containing protein [Chloroflexota bacterium]|nr:DUF4476 domain-containing protein [Lentimicrobium sp.]